MFRQLKVSLVVVFWTLSYSSIALSDSEMEVMEVDEDAIEMVDEDMVELEDENGNTPSDTIIQPNKNIKYVNMPMPEKPRQMHLDLEGSSGVKKQLGSIGRRMKEFVERVSRKKVQLSYSTGGFGSGSSKGPNRVLLVLKPGAHSRVPVIGNAITASHEMFHQFGLGHANVRIWGTQTKVKQASSSRDQFDVMTITPGGVTLNAPHVHFLKWFTDTEEAHAEVGGEYVLRLFNDGNRDFQSLKSLYYQVPGTTREYWFSYVKLKNKYWKTPAGMPGTAIAIHSAAGGSTFLEGLIGMNKETHIRSGLILEVTEPTEKTVKIKVKMDPTWALQN